MVTNTSKSLQILSFGFKLKEKLTECWRQDMSSASIRMATIKDAEEINGIYESYIEKSAITFEYVPVPVEEFRERMRSVLQRLPYLVCEVDHKIVGYAYVSPFKARAAYAWDLEITVYLHVDYYRRNIGSALYQALLELSKQLGYRNIYALITDPNEKSKKLHESIGFKKVGFYPETGYKLGEWWGVNVMWKKIESEEKEPKPTKTVHSLSQETLHSILTNACKLIR